MSKKCGFCGKCSSAGNNKQLTSDEKAFISSILKKYKKKRRSPIMVVALSERGGRLNFTVPLVGDPIPILCAKAYGFALEQNQYTLMTEFSGLTDLVSFGFETGLLIAGKFSDN